MNATDLTELNGKIVLVCSAQDHRNPPTGRRGTIIVQQPEASRAPVVEVDVEFPQMFTTRAHVRRVILSEEEVSQLLASEHYGAFTVTLNEVLDPEASVGDKD